MKHLRLWPHALAIYLFGFTMEGAHRTVPTFRDAIAVAYALRAATLIVAEMERERKTHPKISSEKP